MDLRKLLHRVETAHIGSPELDSEFESRSDIGTTRETTRFAFVRFRGQTGKQCATFQVCTERGGAASAVISLLGLDMLVMVHFASLSGLYHQVSGAPRA
jgi:hypothetical protein